MGWGKDVLSPKTHILLNSEQTTEDGRSLESTRERFCLDQVHLQVSSIRCEEILDLNDGSKTGMTSSHSLLPHHHLSHHLLVKPSPDLWEVEWETDIDCFDGLGEIFFS